MPPPPRPPPSVDPENAATPPTPGSHAFPLLPFFFFFFFLFLQPPACRPHVTHKQPFRYAHRRPPHRSRARQVLPRRQATEVTHALQSEAPLQPREDSSGKTACVLPGRGCVQRQVVVCACSAQRRVLPPFLPRVALARSMPSTGRRTARRPPAAIMRRAFVAAYIQRSAPTQARLFSPGACQCEEGSRAAW